MVSIGFAVGKGHPSIFHHHGRNIKMLVHGDDYFSSGHTEDLKWVADQLSKAYEIQTQRLEMGQGARLRARY